MYQVHFLLLLVNQKCWIINIVFFKQIIQHSIQLLTDPDWLITKSNISRPIFIFHDITYSIFLIFLFILHFDMQII